MSLPRWDPDPPASGEPVAHRFCRLACLTYEDDDGPARRAEAGRMLADDPGPATRDIWAAATAGRADVVAGMLAADPGTARARGGPYGWSPLFHLVYARPEPAPPADDVLRIARLLLDAGADPHEGYLLRGLPTPFTLLTGAFGEGELGPDAQPRHPRSIELATLLLDAGADPNDEQALYNRMFGTDDDHLRLLLAHGLGRGDGDPRPRRPGGPAPAELVAGQVRWAVGHGQHDRLRLLLGSGVADPAVRDGDGRTPAEVAALHADDTSLALLLAAGAAPPQLGPLDAATADLLRGETPGPDRIRRVRTERPGLLVRAVALGRDAGVTTLLGLGFDPDARGRADAWGPEEWETALHTAVQVDRPDLVSTLLRHGADPAARDARFDATPLEWAEHLGHPRCAEVLHAARSG